MTPPAAPSPRRLPSAGDLALAVGVALIALVGFGVSVVNDFPFLLVDHDGQPSLPLSRALLEVSAEALPLAFRRSAPTVVFVLVAGASLADEALNQHPEPLPLAVLVALYTLAVLRRPLVAGIAAAAYLAGLAVDTATVWTDVSDDQLYIHLLAVVGTVTLGCWIYVDRARVARAERQTAEATRAVDTRTAEAVDDERARIAREMHDVLGQQLSVIVAQAATTRRVHVDRPQATADALDSIESVGRDALSALRRELGLLRVDREAPDPGTGLDRLDVLIDQVRRAGLPVQLVVLGDRRPLPADVELTAFRTVQEALTNCLRHSALTPVTVTLAFDSEALDVEVADSAAGDRRPAPRGAGQEPPGDGFGLIGMRQRVELLGGRLTAGFGAGGRFRVHARLPVAPPARRSAG